ncbi:uncharacterized protein LOC106664831 [Cimex lectularius]|uniref:CPR type cuticle protein n=1 Tax=Cimex lectularius TaxID=79782 RepID=A0A8I6RLW9_CIMLE|nr:uncharacterized protein LOC106664831 [Cimex lectularius]
MAALKVLILFAVVACAFADEPAKDERVKKDVLLGTLPYAYAAYPHVYEKYVAAPVAHVPHVPVSYSAVPAVSTYSAVASVPTYVHAPYTYGAYVKPALVY